MDIYTRIDGDLDRMKREICEPIKVRIKEVVEEFFPIDGKSYQYCIDSISVQSVISDVPQPDEKIQPFFLNETDGDIVKWMQLTFDRYGYFPPSFIRDMFTQSRSFKEFIDRLEGILIADFNELSPSHKVCKGICESISKKMEIILSDLEKLADGQRDEKIYINLINEIQKVNDKFQEIGERIALEDFIVDEKEKKPKKLSKEEKKELEEAWGDLKFEWQCKLRWWLLNDWFIHRCKCYSNYVRYKIVPVQDFIQLCKKRNTTAELILKKNLKKCVNVFKIVEWCENDECDQMIHGRLRYPTVLEDGLIQFITDGSGRNKLNIFSIILNETKKMKQNEKQEIQRKQIAELERKILSENYDYELCCAWNDLGGFSLSAVIVGRLLRYRIITQDYVIKSEYMEQREKFFEALERCCETLVYFSQTQSWLMGLVLTSIIFGMYTEQWKGKSPTLEELYISMGYIADILDSTPLQDILNHYPYNRKQMVGRDGFPRKDFDVLWRDERNIYRHFFYREEDDLKKYRERGKYNVFYERVFQIVFRCVNGKTIK